MITATIPPGRFGSPADFWRTLSEMAESAFRSAMRRMEIRRNRRQLRSLPDYLLRDLGIHRSEIDRVIQYGRFNLAGRGPK
jgi:uncharacterized protein YjiS (DUF1127 family)